MGAISVRTAAFTVGQPLGRADHRRTRRARSDRNVVHRHDRSRDMPNWGAVRFDRTRPRRRAAGAAGGCGGRRCPRVGRWRRRPGRPRGRGAARRSWSAVRRTHGVRSSGGPGTPASSGSAGSRAQALAALQPPGPDDAATGLVRHAVAEAVLARLAPVVGLERPLHPRPPRPRHRRSRASTDAGDGPTGSTARDPRAHTSAQR